MIIGPQPARGSYEFILNNGYSDEDGRLLLRQIGREDQVLPVQIETPPYAYPGDRLKESAERTARKLAEQRVEEHVQRVILGEDEHLPVIDLGFDLEHPSDDGVDLLSYTPPTNVM